MRKAALPMVLALMALLWAYPALAQPSGEIDALKKDVEALKQGQSAIQKELQELKELLRAGRPQPPARRGAQPPPSPPEPRDIVVSLDGAPFKGDKNAKVTLVEFTDYQCPFCARHFKQTQPEIEKEYVATGKVKYVLKDLPLESIHPLAFKAAEAAHCAGDQGKYWEMHDRLFANPRALARKDLSEHAKAVGLDVPAFEQCLDAEKHAGRIRKDLEDSQRAGVRGTPGFFLGLTESDGSSLRVARTIRGAVPYGVFKEAIDSLLAGSK